jgi:CHAD domain-containing protein
LDVQIAILKGLRMPDRQNHRAQLLELLIQEHARRSRKLARALSAETVQELRKRLRREQEVIKLSGINPLRLASNILPKLDGMAMTEKALHAYRIAAKQARYLAELAGETPEADFFIQELCRAQDAIGEWHDIMKLKEKAEKRFGSASESALVSMLQNVSRARFRAACNALTSSLATLSQQQPARRPASPVQRDAGPAAPTGASSEPATNAAVA